MSYTRFVPHGGTWRVDLEGDPHAGRKAQAAANLSKSILERVSVKYPESAFAFNCQVDVEAGVAKLAHVLMPVKYAYILHLHELRSTENTFNRLIDKAAGELLERFNMPRGGATRDQWREASQETHWHTKHGFFKREVHEKTGETRLVTPEELVR